MTRTLLLCSLVLLSLAFAANAAQAQDLDTPVCVIPEGCDLDGDGVAETPAGTPVPSEEQYGDEAPAVPGPGLPAPSNPAAPEYSAPAVSGQDVPTAKPGGDGAPAPSDAGSSASATYETLPDTGGVTLPSLVCGLTALVGGSLLLRRLLA